MTPRPAVVVITFQTEEAGLEAKFRPIDDMHADDKKIYDALCGEENGVSLGDLTEEMQVFLGLFYNEDDCDDEKSREVLRRNKRWMYLDDACGACVAFSVPNEYYIAKILMYHYCEM